MRKNPSSNIIYYFFLFLFLNSDIYDSARAQEDLLWTQPFKQCWQHVSSEIVDTEIASDNKLIIVTFPFGILEAFDTTNGTRIWKTELGGDTSSKIQTDEKSVYILNNQSPSEAKPLDDASNKGSTVLLRSLNPLTGITYWSKRFSFDSEPTLYLFNNSLLLTTEKGHLLAINKENGSTNWETKINTSPQNLDSSYNTIIVGASDKRIILISSLDGKIYKEIRTNEIPIKSMLSFSGPDTGKIFWADQKGFLYSLNKTMNKLIWKRRFGGQISSLSDTSEGLLISSVDNFIYLINKSSGKILWKRRLAARITEKPFIRGNLLIAFAFGESTSLFIELKSGKVINSLTLSDANYFVGNPVYASEFLIFPTLKGLYAFGRDCSKIKKTGE
jgi:outer membrane protein assembly factor BamB